MYCSGGTGRQLAYRIAFLEEVLRPFVPGESFVLGELTVHPFATPHDAAESVGYTFTDGNRKAAIVTDLGVVTSVVEQAVAGSHLMVVESNHDPDWVREGPYPFYLKQRVLSQQGHLSNGDCAAFCKRVGAQTVILAHLSAENNSASQALNTVRAVLGDGVTVTVAPRSETGARWQV